MNKTQSSLCTSVLYFIKLSNVFIWGGGKRGARLEKESSKGKEKNVAIDS